MSQPQSAVHSTILVVDVEGFGDPQRTNPHRLVVREGLYRVLQEAFRTAGIVWSDCHYEDCGDGVFVLIATNVAKALLVDSLPEALVQALRRHNDAHRAEERIRLRMALHAGEITYDEHGALPACAAESNPATPPTGHYPDRSPLQSRHSLRHGVQRLLCRPTQRPVMTSAPIRCRRAGMRRW